MRLSARALVRIQRYRKARQGPAPTSADAKAAVALLRDIGLVADPNLAEAKLLAKFAKIKQVASFVIDKVQDPLKREMLMRLHGLAKAATHMNARTEDVYAALDRLPPGSQLGDFRRRLAACQRSRKDRADLATRAEKILEPIAPCTRAEAAMFLKWNGMSRATAYRALSDARVSHLICDATVLITGSHETSHG